MGKLTREEREAIIHAAHDVEVCCVWSTEEEERESIERLQALLASILDGTFEGEGR